MFDNNPWADQNNLPLVPANQYEYIVQFCNYYQHQYYQVLDQLHYAYQTIKNIRYSKKKYIPRKIEYDSHNDEWYCTERNERIVIIGKLNMTSCRIVNVKSDDTFDAIYCTLTVNKEEHKVTIPYKELTHRNILPYLFFFKRNPDCPEKYITALFFILLQNFITNRKNDVSYLSFEKNSGWHESVNEKEEHTLNFVYYINDDPYLDSFMPIAVKKRKLSNNNRYLMDVAKEYSEKLPNNWKYKFLVVLRVSSLLLYFFNKKNISPDKLFLIETANSTNSKLPISLLKNMNYTSDVTYSLTNKPTEISQELKDINDAMAIFRYDSISTKDRNTKQNTDYLYSDIMNATGDEEKTRHLVSIITPYPDKILVSEATFLISLANEQLRLSADEIKNLQRISGEFDFAFIKSIVDFPDDSFKKIFKAIENAKREAKNVDSELQNTYVILISTASILTQHTILNTEDLAQIKKFVSGEGDDADNSNRKIVNECYRILDELISANKVKIVNQNSEPYYVDNVPCIFEEKNYINLNKIVFKDMISKRINVNYHTLLKALRSLEALYSTKDNKRTLKVSLSKGNAEYFDFYSLSKELLGKKSIAKLTILRHFDLLFPVYDNSLPYFTPLINSYDNTHKAGIKITPDSDENFHMYVTGQSGKGKTYFLMQQALFRAQTDDKVIIFDNGGYFTQERLKVFFNDKTDEIIEKYVAFHYIPKDKIPVDLFSLAWCEEESNDPTYFQASRLSNIITSTCINLGKKQINVFTEELKDVAGLINNEKFHDDDSYSKEVCEAIINIITSRKMKDLSLDDHLLGTIYYVRDIKMKRQTWEDFLDSQDKGKVVIITTGMERTELGANLIDMMLASLNAYKVHNPSSRLSVIIDEINFLNLSGTGTINTLAREGRQRKISLILASQDFLKEKLNKFIGNFSTKVFFQPTDCSIVSNYINTPEIDNELLNKLEVGECVVEGDLYDKSKDKNSHTVLHGRTADFVGSVYLPIEVSELIEDEAEINLEETSELSEMQIPEENILEETADETVDMIEQDLPEVSKTTIKVHVLVENTKDATIPGLKCENGLSLFIEYYDKKILLDAGRTEKFADNAWCMLIDLESIDFAVLSNAYIDHSGGFEKYRYNPEFSVYARKEITDQYYFESDQMIEIGMQRVLSNNEKLFSYIDKSKELDNGIYLVEHSAPNLSNIAEKNKLYKHSNNHYEPDDFKHEQTLVFDTINGLIIFNSCSNGGVINIIREVKRFIKDRPIYAYIGGFHICHIDGDGNEECIMTDKEITEICDFIKKENITHVYTGHCTGEKEFQKLKIQLGDIVKRLTTGLEFEL